ncbi:hypothetical protein AAFF_G00232490 [Aldrovandia affinis]|uniref:Uncharacterized protein n=1 Tax=Aldrovandia affinis TaxID=143900 RepID=A0AAD7RF64_9TELE|nr:hypothetical protein AAFF_G00232490 [Aldrovandia affinis]
MAPAEEPVAFELTLPGSPAVWSLAGPAVAPRLGLRKPERTSLKGVLLQGRPGHCLQGFGLWTFIRPGCRGLVWLKLKVGRKEVEETHLRLLNFLLGVPLSHVMAPSRLLLPEGKGPDKVQMWPRRDPPAPWLRLGEGVRA